MNTIEQKKDAFARLLTIMDELRAGCPWDKKQTLESLRPLTIEEMYELSDGILQGNMNEIKGELGDLFLHLVFYSKIGEEKEAFDVADVLNGVCEKLIHRHPHIYGDVKVENEDDVKRNWEQLKLKEGKTSVLQGVPMSLPALVKAWRIQEKAGQVGFEWDNKEDVWLKVQEELVEFQETIVEEQSAARQEDEFGDVLFALVNYARFNNIDPETALERTNQQVH